MEQKEIAVFDFKPEIFDQNKEQLEAIKAEVANVTADPKTITKDELELVSGTRKKLKNARVQIKNRGKEAREAAVKFQKDVIAYEKELIDIIEPEELRLKGIEDEAKEHAMREERRKTLPEFKERLATIGDTVEVDDDFLLSLDPNQRDQYYTSRLQAKLEADKAAIEAQAAAELAAKQAEAEKVLNNRIEIMLEIGFKRTGTGLQLETLEGMIDVSRETVAAYTESVFIEGTNQWRKYADAKKAADIKAAEEAAAEKAKKEAEQTAAAEEAKRQADEKAAKEAAEAEAAKEKAEQEARQSSEAYQKWLSDNSYNAETDIVQEKDGVYTLYRRISSFQPQAFGFEVKE